MLIKFRNLFLRFLLLSILSSVITASIMYAYSKIKFYFRLGENWNTGRYYDWFYFFGMLLQIFPIVIVAYLFFYWLFQSSLQNRMESYRSYSRRRPAKPFYRNLIWTVLFATGMLLIPFILTMKVWQILLYWLSMCALGLLFPLIDNFVRSMLQNKINR